MENNRIKKLDSIGDVLQENWRQSIDFDVHIIAGDKWNQKLFNAHKSILTVRSDYFKVALSDQWVRKDQNGIIIFRKENISPEIFDLLLNYVYTGKVSVALCSTNFDFVDLIGAAEEILLSQLVDSLERYLIDTYLSQSTKSFEVEAWLKSNIIRLVSLKKDIPNGLSLVRSRFEEHVRIAGRDSIQEIIPSNGNAITDSTIYVNTLLKVFNKYNHIVQTIFKDDAGFVESFNEFCYEFINRNELCGTNSVWLSSHLLVEFCDLSLRRNKKNPIVDIKDVMNNIINIFKYLHDKDVFEKFYSQMLAERLLTQCSEEVELTLISRLEIECGLEYTSKIRLMFHNIGLSKDLNNQFKKHLDSDDTEQIDFYVLDMTTWPMLPITSNLIIPNEIEKTFQRFRTFYENKYSCRKLKWLYHLSKGELKTNYLKTSKVFQVSTYQMSVLLQYNKNTSYTLEELCQYTGIDQGLLNHQLDYLINVKVLLREKFGYAKTKYTLNFEFNSNAFRIILKDPEETMQQKRKLEIEIKIKRKRKYSIENAVFGLVRSNRGIHLYSLIACVIQRLKNEFVPKVPDINKTIESLIEREYIERVDNKFYKIP